MTDSTNDPRRHSISENAAVDSEDELPAEVEIDRSGCTWLVVPLVIGLALGIMVGVRIRGPVEKAAADVPLLAPYAQVLAMMAGGILGAIVGTMLGAAARTIRQWIATDLDQKPAPPS